MVHLVALAVMRPLAFDMQTALDGIRSTNKLPAMGCAVIGMKTAPKIFVTGVRKVGDPSKAQVTDTWHLGSCTKAMTAAVVASYVQQGAFPYTSTFKSLCGLTNAIYYYKDQTLDNLVHMTADLDHDPAKGWFYYEGLAQTEVVKRKKAAVDMTLAKPLEVMSPPYHYSNASFVFAGLACELYARNPIETLLKQRIFTPLKLTSAAYGPNPPGMPWPHVNGVPVPANGVLDNPPVMTAAGRVRISLHDWAFWAREVMKSIRNRPTLDGPCLLPSLYGKRLAAAPSNDFYVDGWIKTTRSWSAGPVFTHAGSNTLNYADIWLAPAEGFAYLSVTNDGGSTAFTGCDTAVWDMISNHVQ